MNRRLLPLAALALAAGPAQADKGHVWPAPVSLAETSQKAILLHDGRGEELLVLGVELAAAREAEILEFIPFPAQPEVSGVDGDPFDRARKLIAGKRLEFPRGEPTKGGGGRAAVELKLAARIGLHDVAVVEVNDAAGFEAWVRRFFEEKGLPASLDLGAVVPVVEDYVGRGFRYFAFDRVTVGTEVRQAEPLAYRFRSERIYYPLRTSNIVGGKGVVDLVMVLPGSLLVEQAPEPGQRLWRALREISGDAARWRVSSSAKVTPREVEAVVPGAARFLVRTPKVYLQVLEFAGPYRFAADLLLDPADLRPWADKLPPFELDPSARDFFSGFSAEEIGDYCEANPAVPPCRGRAPSAKPRAR